MDDAHAAAEVLREANKKNSNGGSSGSKGGSGSGSKGGSSSGRSRGSSKDDAARRQAEEARVRRQIEAQIAAMLKGNESAQTYIDMINADKLSYELAKAGGLMDDAELYHQRAEILRQGLYELEARRGRDISDIINARGDDAGKWEAYTLTIACEDAAKDGVDSREATVIHNRVEEYNSRLGASLLTC